MTEQKVKNRGWVKNAAIIFLSIMLLLTFFSNTILNRSLPEVATSAAISGTINTKIRGSGIVKANESYEVMVNESRKVKSVNVRVGDEIEAGTLLFVLSDEDSNELEAAKENLESLKIAYQKAVISASGEDYARENRDIQRARETLAEAIAERDKLKVSDIEITRAERAVKSAKEDVEDQEAAVEDAQRRLDDAEPPTGSSSQLNALYRQVQDKYAALTETEAELEVTMAIYGTEYEQFVQDVIANYSLTQEQQNTQLELYLAAEAEKRQEIIDSAASGSPVVDAEYDAYLRVSEVSGRVKQLKKEYDDLHAQYSNMRDEMDDGAYNEYSADLKSAQRALADLQEDLRDAESKLAELEANKAKYETAAEAVKSAERSLEDMLFSLQETQKADNISSALEQLDMQKMREDIAEAEEKVLKLSGEAAGTEIFSENAGTVSAINISAGNSTIPGEIMATIDVTDRGYSLSFAVTNEQSQKVSVGTAADVTGYYWGNTPQVTLAAIRTDPSAPREKKLLVFDIKGEIETGANLNISIGQRSASYEVIVPNSAIRTDSNGDFVLAIETRNSPVGNRYVAQRVDVNILAKDDTNCAVSGGLTNSDFVITTSSKPIEPGMQVRMADDN